VEEGQLRAEFHRAVVHDCDLVPATIGEDPRGRCAMAPHPSEIREVDSLSLECLPVVAREVLTDKARERRRNPAGEVVRPRAAPPRGMSVKSRTRRYGICPASHRSASRSFAYTRSASTAGHRAESPSPTNAASKP